MKNPIIYRRQGWQDSTFEGVKAEGETVNLLNEEGKVIVSQLPFIADPSEVDPADLPKAYGTPANSRKAPPQVDEGKVDSAIAKINQAAETDPFTVADLNRVNVPTLQAIAARLNLSDVPAGATSGDLKDAIVKAAEAVSANSGDGEPDPNPEEEPPTD